MEATLLRNTRSSSPSNHQAPIASQLQTLWPPPLLVLGLSMCGVSLHGPCACSHSYCEFICATALLCPEKQSPCGHAQPLALLLFPPPTPSLKRRVYDTDVSFRAEHFIVRYPLHLNQLWVLYVNLILFLYYLPFYLQKQTSNS